MLDFDGYAYNISPGVKVKETETYAGGLGASRAPGVSRATPW